MTSPSLDFSKILTPQFCAKILAYHFPWEGKVDIKFASKFYFRGGANDSAPQVYDTVHHAALKPISKLVPSVPSLSPYLPDPNKRKEYLEQTLAFFVLVDQGPRRLYYDGMDARYTNAYFDKISLKLVHDLLFKNLFPDATEDWISIGYSFEDAMIRKLWLYTPLHHSENLRDHEIADAKTEEMRKEVEKYTGKRDPGRDTQEEDAVDVYLFFKLATQGPPETFAEFMFWLFRMLDAHTPIIKEFGHYPYRNQLMGRGFTAAETKWLEDTNQFGMPDITNEQVEKIKRQTKDGTWDELSDKGPF